jgi:hypothetical protein
MFSFKRWSAARVATYGLLVSFALTAHPASQAAPHSYMKALKDAEADIGPVAVFDNLGKLSADERDALLQKYNLQWLGFQRSLSGDATGAAQAFAWWTMLKRPVKVDPEALKALDTATAEDAIQAIVREAKNRQVVILNEAHHIPLDRVFAARLAHELRNIGFDYLACEALHRSDPVARPHGYFPMESGFYTNEPMFAEFLRGAVKDKWQFAEYDPVPDQNASTIEESMRLRELGAVDNLMNKIFLKDPKARVFIYVGYSHASERPAYVNDKTHAWLAALLAHRLGIDPLTIDQSTMFSYDSQREAEHPLYRPALRRFGRSEPFVLKSSQGGYEVLGGYRHKIDMQVFHPDDARVTATGRPAWMETQAHLRPRPVPAQLLPTSGRRLIQAFHAEDGDDAVPADMVMVEAGKSAPMLMLPADGEFRYSFEE